MEKEKMFLNDGKSGGIPYGISGMHPEKELNCSFFKPNWENSMDQGDPFESALSSMVSSPTASNANGNGGGNNIVLRELIGRLGSLCNSGEISPTPNYSINGTTTTTTTTHNNHIISSSSSSSSSANTSCYSTPLNSPPKLNLSTLMESQQQQMRGNLQHFPSLGSFAPFSTDPGFAERAARFSCFANRSLGGGGGGCGLTEMPPRLGGSGKISSDQSIKISGSPAVQENWDGTLQEAGIPASDIKFARLSRSSTPENGDSRENSSVSEQIPGVEAGMMVAQNDSSSRKRKSTPKGKGTETTPAAAPKDANAAASENSESSAKRSKSEDEKDAAKTNKKQTPNDNSKPPEPPKDYIHVRARRGQATDAHSLAERVRREKISERMKVLQDLVPGCNKVTGKAVMLDEIINYVQSLQRQVEFLSMKLATVNPRMDFNMEALMSKDMFQSRVSLPHNIYPSDGCYPFQPQSNLHNAIPCGTDAAAPPNNFTAAAALPRNQLPPMDSFSETASQVSSTFWEDDLHSIVQMGFGQNQTQSFQGIMATAQMKVEL